MAQTLLRSGIDEPFMVKDSDNYFAVPHLYQNYNYVCVASLSSFSQVNPQNKSYVQVDQEDVIVNFREKQGHIGPVQRRRLLFHLAPGVSRRL